MHSALFLHRDLSPLRSGTDRQGFPKSPFAFAHSSPRPYDTDMFSFRTAAVMKLQWERASIRACSSHSSEAAGNDQIQAGSFG